MLTITLLWCNIAEADENDLLVEYYITRAGVTEQIFPDDDWQYVKDVAIIEPVTLQLTVVWLNYDLNTLAMTIDNINNGKGCDYAGAFSFTDVALVPTEKYKDAQTIAAIGLVCEVFLSKLAVAINETP